jgi:hypothetical protein
MATPPRPRAGFCFLFLACPYLKHRAEDVDTFTVKYPADLGRASPSDDLRSRRD